MRTNTDFFADKTLLELLDGQTVVVGPLIQKLGNGVWTNTSRLGQLQRTLAKRVSHGQSSWRHDNQMRYRFQTTAGPYCHVQWSVPMAIRNGGTETVFEEEHVKEDGVVGSILQSDMKRAL